MHTACNREITYWSLITRDKLIPGHGTHSHKSERFIKWNRICSSLQHDEFEIGLQAIIDRVQ